MKRLIYKYIIKNEYNGKIVADSKGNEKIFHAYFEAIRYMETHCLNPTWYRVILKDRVMVDE